MNLATSPTTLFKIIQSIPVPVSMLINFIMVVGMCLLLRKQRSDALSIRIINHTLLFMIAWIAFSVIMGLMLTFDLLELTITEGLFGGFLYGFRVAMAIVPCGVLTCCIPIIWILRMHAAQHPH